MNNEKKPGLIGHSITFTPDGAVVSIVVLDNGQRFEYSTPSRSKEAVNCAITVGVGKPPHGVPLYTHPAPQVPMTDEEIENAYRDHSWSLVVDSDEAYRLGVVDTEAHHKIGVKP